MMRRPLACRWIVILVGAVLGCQTTQTKETPEPAGANNLGALLSTEEMRDNAFTLHQQLRFSFAGRSGKLDSVIQKKCDSLVVVGLGPLNTRIFTLRQVARQLDYEPKRLEKWPVPPLRILLDVHRIYLYPLPNPPPPDGVHESRVADMQVTEHWKAGRLWRRILSNPPGRAPERIKIDYAGGFIRGEKPPPIVLEDELRRYRLEVETVSFRRIECKN